MNEKILIMDSKNSSILSKIIVLILIILCISIPDYALIIFKSISYFVFNNMKWFIILATTSIILFLIYLAFSKYSHIKLSKDNENPDYSFFSWISMLFSCGMGIGLVFFGVAEPIHHYANNPFSEGITHEASTHAIQLTFFHWGLHAWGIYCIVALTIGYLCYRKDLPFAFRSALYPLIGNRIYGWIGNLIDIIVTVVTCFGISQTLAIGVLQINSGLQNVFGIGINLTSQFFILITLSGIASFSVVCGIGNGMKRISQLNILLSILIIFIVLCVGPASYIANTYIEGIGNYTQNFISMSLWLDSQKNTDWQNWWTAFYWLWWATWAPFVGIFIAKISKGRTIKQLILGVLIIPTLVTFFWVSVFGGSALKYENDARIEHQSSISVSSNNSQLDSIKSEVENKVQVEKFEGSAIVKATKIDNTHAIFSLYDVMSSGYTALLLSLLTCILLITYVVTSQDGGTHVLCFFDTKSTAETPKNLRIQWCLYLTLLSAGLIYAGGFNTIQHATALFGFPLLILLSFMPISIMKSLKEE